jgi:heme a synthase
MTEQSQPGGLPRTSLPLSRWLYACCALVFLMVIVGAITRLREAGLSITEWQPVTGILPPLNEAQWSRAFDLYKASPEFRAKHFWMGLADFKAIFFWEWLHRLLGRLTGLAFALPLAVFWARGMIPPGWKPRLLLLLALGGAQGFMGWFMVQSGLTDNPSVSHYRLAAHLALAFLIYALLLWSALALSSRKPGHGDARLYCHGWGVLAVFALAIVWGAFTAGLDAGLVYSDTFPKMGAHFLPPEMWHLTPAWINVFETPAAVQFTHRVLALAITGTVLSLWVHALARRASFPALHALTAMVLVQAGLGIATLLSGVALPLAVLHQAGALIVLTLLVISLHRLRSR